MARNLKDIYVGVKHNDEERRENDLYETPPLATYILHKYGEIPKGRILEPCAGRGNIAIELQRCGCNVEAKDLNEYSNYHFSVETGVDVLTTDNSEKIYTSLITNPPYHKDLPRKITQLGVEQFDYTAMFVRLTFLEGTKRKKIFDKYPPSKIIIFSDRIKFKANVKDEPISRDEQIGGMICYMWIIWNKSAKQKIEWISLENEYDEWFEHYNATKT